MSGPHRSALKGKHSMSFVGLGGALALSLLGCAESGASQAKFVLRGADEVQVMSAAQVAALRQPIVDPADASKPNEAGETSSETVPLNADNRAPEVKLFAAYQKFNACLKADGFKIEGNLQDPKNPAFQNKEYVASLTKCAARTDILNVVRATQEATSKLTPEEVKGRNEIFKALSECLKQRGWTVELSVNSIGLLQPQQFRAADGTLNERDLDQCLTETGVNTSDPGGP